jgi:hypothetical protein
MLSKEQWEDVEKFVNGEYISQVEDTGYEAALLGVQLALAFINEDNFYALLATFLGKFCKYQNPNIPIPTFIRRDLYIRNYGEKEVEAMIEAGEVFFEKGA